MKAKNTSAIRELPNKFRMPTLLNSNKVSFLNTLPTALKEQSGSQR